MPRGGPRPNAGRKSGSRDRIAQAQTIVEQHAAEIGDVVPDHIARMSPLQIMLRAMSLAAAENKWPQAAALAKEAAPYVHARLSSVEMNANVRRSIDDFADEELAEIAGEGEGSPGTDAEGGS
jgi:hypothetical protein